MKLSTGLRNKLAGATGFGATFDNGVIHIFSGPPPLSADSAATGTLLGIVTVDGAAFVPGAPANGLGFDVPVNGVVSKAAAENWRFLGIAAGVAGWFRLMGNALDSGASSAVLPRLDGTVAVSGADMNLSNISIVVGAPNTIDVFQFTVPAQ